MEALSNIIRNLPLGYTQVEYCGEKYGMNVLECNGGKSRKVFARSLAGTDLISLNFYSTDAGDILKPCEMPEEKVIHFLENHRKLYSP